MLLGQRAAGLGEGAAHSGAGVRARGTQPLPQGVHAGAKGLGEAHYDAYLAARRQGRWPVPVRTIDEGGAVGRHLSWRNSRFLGETEAARTHGTGSW
jgi:hypothetical protein